MLNGQQADPNDTSNESFDVNQDSSDLDIELAQYELIIQQDRGESEPPPLEGLMDDPMPAFDAGEVEQKGVSKSDIEAARDEISRLIKSSTKPIRSGDRYSLTREFPKWKTTSELRDLAYRPINWAVSNLWTERAKILLAAEQKAGKTFIVAHIAMCYATGMPLFGNDRFNIVAGGPVGIIAGEDDDSEIGRRLDRMFRAQGLVMSNYPVHFLSGHRLRLNREQDQEFVRDSVRELGLKLVVYDPLARLMDGDENSKEIVSAVLNPASALAIEEGVSVMVVHHLGKQSTDTPRTAIARVRGSSDITSWFSCGMFLSGNMRLGKIDLEVVQRTSGNTPNEFPITIKEDQEESVYGLGTMRFIADLSQDDKSRAGRNEMLIDEAAQAIEDLLDAKGEAGVTRSEVTIHLGYGSSLMNAAIKKLVREKKTAFFEKAEGLPDKQILFGRRNGRHNVVPLPTNYQEPEPEPEPSEPQDRQLCFDPHGWDDDV
jgi:hypothetical protein